MKAWLEGARARLGAWQEERRARAAAKRMNAHHEHAHGRFFLLHVPATATILAAVTEWYWALLFCIEATGSIDWNYETAVGNEATREAANAAVSAAATEAKAAIDNLASAVDATPEQLALAAREAQTAAQALAAAAGDPGANEYVAAYSRLAEAVEAARPNDIQAAADAARESVEMTASAAEAAVPLVDPNIWNFAFSAHWPVLLGLVCATVPIVMLSMVWLPVQFAMRGSGLWRRGTVIFVGLLANILVIVSGTVVMNYNRQDQVREALVVEETAAANRGAIQAQIDAVNADLERLTDRRINNEYAATAANVGAVAYRAQYMSEEALQRSPAQRRDIIVRALGAAERADALRAERTALFQQLASAPTESAVAANVADNVGRELNTFAQYVEVWRPPFVAVICTLIGIFGAWWTLALLQGLNPRDVLRSGWADEAHRIEDLREEAAITPQPYEQATREVVTDAETGEELVKVKPREYWRRRVPKKGKRTRVAIEPDIPPDETGVAVDGGGRAGSVGAPATEPESSEEHAEVSQPEQRDDDPVTNAHADVLTAAITEAEQDEPPPPDDDLAELYAEAELELTEPPVEAPDADEQQSDEAEPDQQNEHVELPGAEGVMVPQDEPERAPETREDRLLPASVAAE